MKNFMELAGNLVKLSDVSFVGALDRHINYSQQASAHNTTWYIPLIVGGQVREIKGKDKAETEELRDKLIKGLRSV